MIPAGEHDVRFTSPETPTSFVVLPTIEKLEKCSQQENIVKKEDESHDSEDSHDSSSHLLLSMKDKGVRVDIIGKVLLNAIKAYLKKSVLEAQSVKLGLKP